MRWVSILFGVYRKKFLWKPRRVVPAALLKKRPKKPPQKNADGVSFEEFLAGSTQRPVVVRVVAQQVQQVQQPKPLDAVVQAWIEDDL